MATAGILSDAHLKDQINTLEHIVNEKRKQIERDSYSKSVPLAKFYDKEKLAFLEPILGILKSMHERLETLEKREYVRID